MRIALVYDCLYPYTIGGAERWYRTLAEHLAANHQVVYITRRQWEPGSNVDAPAGVQLAIVSAGKELYTASGRRKISIPLRFGWGVFWHLLRHRGRYDVVHTCGFPYFALLAARFLQILGGAPVVTDWFEVWQRPYWRAYLGPVAGSIGAAIERLCVRLTRHAFVFSKLGAERLRIAGYRGEPVILRGIYGGPVVSLNTGPGRGPTVVFVGRHIAEKRVVAIPATIAIARQRIPGLQAVIFGNGPESAAVRKEVKRLGLAEAIACPGFAPWKEIDATLRSAMCLLLPSQREGYGLVVVEAAACGTPSVVALGPDNAAIELVSDGVNGVIALSPAPQDLADAIVRVHALGERLVGSTYDWFAANARDLSVESSIPLLEHVYEAVVRRGADTNGAPTIRSRPPENRV